MKQGEKGYTLIETLVTLSIWVLVGAAVTTGIYQIFSNSQHNTNHMSAVLQLEAVDQR